MTSPLPVCVASPSASQYHFAKASAPALVLARAAFGGSAGFAALVEVGELAPFVELLLVTAVGFGVEVVDVDSPPPVHPARTIAPTAMTAAPRPARAIPETVGAPFAVQSRPRMQSLTSGTASTSRASPTSTLTKSGRSASRAIHRGLSMTLSASLCPDC